MNKIEVKCESCDKKFFKLKKEINRCKKNKMGNYCSRSCTATYRNSLMTNEYWKKQYEKYPHIKNYIGNRKDEYSPFRCFINHCKSRNRDSGLDVNINVVYLKKLWESQKGLCAYTKVKMILPETINGFSKLHSLKRASLDRIDSSMGYIEGNVEFVCYAINNAKNSYSKEEMISFIKDIIQSQNTLSITQAQPT